MTEFNFTSIENPQRNFRERMSMANWDEAAIEAETLANDWGESVKYFESGAPEDSAYAHPND